MRTVQRARVISQQGRDGRVESSNGELAIDLKQENSPNPEHLFAAAYAACFHSALMSAAESAHHDITGSTVAVEADLNEDNAGNSSLGVEIRPSIPGVSRKEANRLIQRAHETCPYSKAVRGNVDVVITLD